MKRFLMRWMGCGLIFYVGLFSGNVSAEPTIAESIVPRFIQGRNGTNSQRIPCAYWVRIGGLTANATYRYFNQVVRSSDSPTTDGAGNSIFANPDGFVRTSSPSLSTAGNHGEFTADGSGSFAGWMVTEPTGNARFIPGGFVFFRIMLNDGADGTAIAFRLTTADSLHVLKLDAESSDSSGTGLRANTLAAARDFVLLYDDTEGTGRPLTAAFVENDGSENSTSNNYAVFYSDHVNAVDGAFGVIVPNNNSSGVRRVERRSIAGEILAYAQSTNGQWPSGANTANPTGGAAPIVLTDGDVPLSSMDVTERISAEQPLNHDILNAYPNPFNASTTIVYNVTQAQHVTLRVFDLAGREVALLKNGFMPVGRYQRAFNGTDLPSGIYFARLSGEISTQIQKLVLLK